MNIKSWRIIFFPFLLLAILNLAGCVTTQPMALNARPGDTGISQQLLLVSLKTYNAYHHYYQPDPQFLLIKDENGKQHIFALGDMYRATDSGHEYLISVALPPGKYILEDITGYSGVYPIRGFFDIPIYSHFKVGEKGVIYLGRIEATLVERHNSNELRGGSVFPLVDQAVTGYSMGTFSIKIYDNYAEDMFNFKNKYPALIDLKIAKNILPPWTQPSEAEMR